MKFPLSGADLVNVDQQRSMIDAVREKRPDIWKSFELPRYAPQNGYRSYTHLTAMLAANEVDFEYRLKVLGTEAINTVSCIVSSAAWKQQQFRFPLAYVSRDILDAALATELPDWMQMNEIHWPLPAMTFMLPQGFLVSPLGNEAMALSICHVTPEETQTLLQDFKDKVRATIPARLTTSRARLESGTIFIWATMIDKSGLMKTWGMDRPLLGPVSDSLVTYAKIGDVIEGTEDQEAMDNEWWHGTCATLAINLIMLMVERPELVESSRLLKTVRKKNSAPVQLWQPRWIGRTFKFTRSSECALGTHASPRTHWRVGHWRQQAHGPKHSLRKTIWIEPVFVGGVIDAG